MKKKIIIYLSMFVIFTAFGFGCEKERYNNELSTRDDSEIRKIFVYNASFGKIHNEICDTLLTMINNSNNEIVIQNIDSVMLILFDDLDTNELSDFKQMICDLKNKSFFEQQKNDSSAINDEDMFYLKLDSIFNKYDGFDTATIQLNKLFNNIIKSNLIDAKKGKALSVVDFSKNSIQFWNDYQQSCSNSKFLSINDVIDAAKTDVSVGHKLIQGYLDIGYSWEAISNNKGIIQRIARTSAYCSLADLLFDTWSYRYYFKTKNL